MPKSNLVDKFFDSLRPKIVDYVMKQGKKLGGPFIGGDEETTRELVELVLTPSKWGQAPYKVVLMASKTVDPLGDIPGVDPATQSSRPPIFSAKDFEEPPETNAPLSMHDDSSYQGQLPDRELMTNHANQDGRTKDVASSSNAEAHKSPQTAQPASPPKADQQQSTGGQASLPPQPSLVRGPDGTFHTEASAAPAQPAPQPTPESHEGGREHDPMRGAHDFGHGTDKKDTLGGRDVRNIA